LNYNKIKIVAIIPARMESSRFPGKPLINILGLPMIEHVRRRALLCKKFDKIIVATCNKEIFDCVKFFGGNVIMTSKKHLDCTDRIVEASKKIKCTHVVNVQGDAILTIPKDLDKLCKNISKFPEENFWNLISQIKDENDMKDNSIVKCFINSKKNIYFLYRRFDLSKMSNSYRVFGLMAYSKKALNHFAKLKPSLNELIYSIEQFRIIENGYNIKSLISDHYYPDINKKRDVGVIEKYFKYNNLQKKILRKVLY